MKNEQISHHGYDIYTTIIYHYVVYFTHKTFVPTVADKQTQQLWYLKIRNPTPFSSAILYQLNQALTN